MESRFACESPELMVPHRGHVGHEHRYRLPIPSDHDPFTTLDGFKEVRQLCLRLRDVDLLHGVKLREDEPNPQAQREPGDPEASSVCRRRSDLDVEVR